MVPGRFAGPARWALRPVKNLSLSDNIILNLRCALFFNRACLQLKENNLTRFKRHLAGSPHLRGANQVMVLH